MHLHVGQFECNGLIVDDRAAELLALFRVVERELVRRSRNAERLGADGRSTRLKGRHRGLALGALALARPSDLLIELLLAAEETTPRNTTVLEHHFAGVAGANAHLLELLAEADALRAFGHDERRLAAAAEFRLDRGDDDVQVRDTAVGDPGLGAVEDPLVVRLVVDRAGAK